MAEGKSVGNNLNYMKGSMDRWAAIGAPISEEDQVVKVICQVWTYLFTFYSYLLLLYICLLILILCYMSQVYLTISKLQNYPSCHLNCFCYVMPSLCHLEIPLPVIMHLTLCVIFFQTILLYEVFTVWSVFHFKKYSNFVKLFLPFEQSISLWSDRSNLYFMPIFSQDIKTCSFMESVTPNVFCFLFSVA